MLQFKLVLQLFIALFLSFQSLAQSALYLDAGYNSSSIISDDPVFDAASGYYIGIHYSELYDSKFEISTSIQYSARGVRLSSFDKQRFPFLDGLFTLGFRPVQEMTLFGGVSIGKLMGDDFVVLNRELDYGLLGGIKYDFKHIILKAHYNRGLLNQSDNSNVTSYTSNIQVGLGFKLNFSPVKKEENILIAAPLTIDSISTVVKHHQIALALGGFSNFNMIYKKKIGNNRYFRTGLLAARLFNQNSGNQQFSEALLTWEFGLENRSQLDDKTYMVQGPQFILGGRLTAVAGSEGQIVLTPGLGYLLGFYHELSDRFHFGLELLPSVRYATVLGDDLNSNLNFNFNTQSVRLVAGYNFTTTKKK